MNRQDQPLVSIVTPAYNCAPYIGECIESVLAQTYHNWDYTIINNCSTDDTLLIAEQYAARDPRIRVRTNTAFVRAIANHNIAFRSISPESDYCKLIQADDWMFPECVEAMVRVAHMHPSVGIVGAYGLMSTQVMWAGLPYPSTVVSGREICRSKLLGGPYIFGTPTSVLFRAGLVRHNDPFYNESTLHADTEACFQLLQTCDFGFVHQVLTYSRERPGSLTTLSDSLNSVIARILTDLAKFGPHYLTEDELSNQLRRHLGKYYKFLAQSLVQRRDKQFWSFHVHKLNEAGVGFSRWKLAKAVCAGILNAVLNPKMAIWELMKGEGVLNRRMAKAGVGDQVARA